MTRLVNETIDSNLTPINDEQTFNKLETNILEIIKDFANHATFGVTQDGRVYYFSFDRPALRAVKDFYNLSRSIRTGSSSGGYKLDVGILPIKKFDTVKDIATGQVGEVIRVTERFHLGEFVKYRVEFGDHIEEKRIDELKKA